MARGVLLLLAAWFVAARSSSRDDGLLAAYARSEGVFLDGDARALYVRGTRPLSGDDELPAVDTAGLYRHGLKALLRALSKGQRVERIVGHGFGGGVVAQELAELLEDAASVRVEAFTSWAPLLLRDRGDVEVDPSWAPPLLQRQLDGDEAEAPPPSTTTGDNVTYFTTAGLRVETAAVAPP